MRPSRLSMVYSAPGTKSTSISAIVYYRRAEHQTPISSGSSGLVIRFLGSSGLPGSSAQRCKGVDEVVEVSVIVRVEMRREVGSVSIRVAYLTSQVSVACNAHYF